MPIWEKFILLVHSAGLNALTRLPLGKWRADPDLLALFEAALDETVAVGRAEGVDSRPTVPKRPAPRCGDAAYQMTSMGNDLLRGNRLERLVRRQNCRSRPPPQHPNPGQRLYICGAKALRQRGAGLARCYGPAYIMLEPHFLLYY